MANTYIILMILGIILLMGVILYLFHRLRKNKKLGNKYGYNSAPKLIDAYTDTLKDAEGRMQILSKQLVKEEKKYKELKLTHNNILEDFNTKYKELKDQFELLAKENKKLRDANFELTKTNEILKTQL